jgi:hypothetical protein
MIWKSSLFSARNINVGNRSFSSQVIFPLKTSVVKWKLKIDWLAQYMERFYQLLKLLKSNFYFLTISFLIVLWKRTIAEICRTKKIKKNECRY